MQTGLKRRAGPLFGAALTLAALLGAVTPFVPKVAATDPSAAPSVTQVPATSSPSPDVTQPAGSPTPAPAPTQTPAPTSSPTASATDVASASPSPSDSATPSGSAGPSGSPSPTDSTAASPSPSPSSAAPSPSPSPSATLAPAPIAPLALVNPTSPHIVPDTLSSDTCAACHRTHTATNEDILASTYRINPLRPSGQAYASTDFALCWSCHSKTKAAIEDATGATAGTNFPGHGFHLKSIGSFGSGGIDITVPGDGQGNALCAECHYNLHGTADSQRGLVVFAPDVLPFNGQPITYDASSGTCTLTCHGVNHDGATVPATVPATVTAPADAPASSPLPSLAP